ncbi:MAG: potassium-transporting ATPase subunit KdpA, partial [Dongiaceae bacterium]
MNDFLLLNLVFFGVLTVAAYALSFALTYSAGQSKKFPMQDWRAYGKAMLALHFVGFIILFLMLCWQHVLPWNPLQLPGLAWDRAFNIAISFVSQTNWQSYQGEITLSPFTQMAGLTVQNFLSAAIGMTAGMVILRAVAYPAEKGIGNFWADLRASILYILLPLSFVLAIFLLWQGVPQSFQAYQPITTLEGQAQLLPLGNAASQIAIKQVGDNGGGFYGANSAHPFENPTALSNFVEMLAML